jgi:hypothetical protein
MEEASPRITEMSSGWIRELLLNGIGALSALVSVVIVGCGPVPEPIIDKTGVDQGKYSRDLADCYWSMPFFALGNPLATCMHEKGYTILAPR